MALECNCQPQHNLPIICCFSCSCGVSVPTHTPLTAFLANSDTPVWASLGPVLFQCIRRIAIHFRAPYDNMRLEMGKTDADTHNMPSPAQSQIPLLLSHVRATQALSCNAPTALSLIADAHTSQAKHQHPCVAKRRHSGL